LYWISVFVMYSRPRSNLSSIPEESELGSNDPNVSSNDRPRQRSDSHNKRFSQVQLQRPPIPMSTPAPRSETNAMSALPSQLTSTSVTVSECTPLPWNTCFDERYEMLIDDTKSGSKDTFVAYSAGNAKNAKAIVLLMHGGGHSALSWGRVASILSAKDSNGDGEETGDSNVLVVAYDARGHGETRCVREDDLSGEQQLVDSVNVMRALLETLEVDLQVKVLVVGHSMGGAMAIKLAASRMLEERIAGVAVIDVVEGTALASLPYMSTFLQNRPKMFETVSHAIQYVVNSGQVKNLESARLSVPPQVQSDGASESVRWRTDLEASEQYWNGWFQGISNEFLSAPAAKLLILAGVDRFDRDLTIAQMQGKFQTLLMQDAGHAVHEDQPEQTALALLNFMKRNLILIDSNTFIPKALLGKKPTPPCC